MTQTIASGNAGERARTGPADCGESPTNVSYWECSGQIPGSDVLLPIAKALGVTVEELLGEPRPRRAVSPGGKLGSLVEQISKLPRRQQEKVIENAETYLRGLARKSA